MAKFSQRKLSGKMVVGAAVSRVLAGGCRSKRPGKAVFLTTCCVLGTRLYPVSWILSVTLREGMLIPTLQMSNQKCEETFPKSHGLKYQLIKLASLSFRPQDNCQ